MADEDLRYVLEHYALGVERERLDSPLGVVEFERTTDELRRHLPPPPARLADIGGGPGRYSLWLAEQGYAVVHRDVVAHHVEELRQTAEEAEVEIDTDVGDARDLSLPSAGFDGVLLLGPLYHLTRRSDRLRALGEAGRILRPEGVVIVAAISRWAPRLHAEVATRLYREIEGLREEVERVERSGRMPPLRPGDFAGYTHRPGQLRREIRDAGLECIDLMTVEGIAFALSDLEERLSSPEDREVVLQAARRLGRVPELLGLGPHLLAVARRR